MCVYVCVSISVHLHTFPRMSTLLLIPLGQVITSISLFGFCTVAALIYNVCFSKKSSFIIVGESIPHQSLKLILKVREIKGHGMVYRM